MLSFSACHHKVVLLLRRFEGKIQHVSRMHGNVGDYSEICSIILKVITNISKSTHLITGCAHIGRELKKPQGESTESVDN